jgi:glc operon protein GlcG
MRPALLAILLSCVPASLALAQTRDVKTLTLEGARRVAAGAESEARRRGWDVAIAVVDPSGGLIVFHRMDGVQHASLDIAIEKARASARFRRPSKALAEAVGKRGVVGLVGVDGMLMMEGAVPVTVDSVVVGAVGISGMTGAQDAEIAEAGVAALRP